MQRGKFFGEKLLLLSNAPSEATVTARNGVVLSSGLLFLHELPPYWKRAGASGSFRIGQFSGLTVGTQSS